MKSSIFLAIQLLAFVFISHTTTAIAQEVQPNITTPAAGATLDGSDITVGWAINDPTGEVQEYWLYAGDAPGEKNYFNSSVGNVLSAQVSGLPTDGSNVYLQLWFKTAEKWFMNPPIAYEAASSGFATLVIPTTGAEFSSSSHTFSWLANDPDQQILEYWLYVGSSPGQREYYSKSISSALSSINVSGLPSDGTSIFTQLWYKTASGWTGNDPTEFLAGTFTGPEITTPIAGSLLDPMPTFGWVPNGESGNIEEYWLFVGSSPGEKNYYNKSVGVSLQVSLNSLPSDGTEVYVVLWYKTSAGWSKNDPIAFTSASEIASPPELETPLASSKFDSSEQIFTWSQGSSTNNISEYWLYVGDSPNARNYFNASTGTSLNAQVANLPTDGSAVYATIWYKENSGWKRNESVEYTAANIHENLDLSDYELVFNDEFSGTSLDASKWNTGLLWGPYLPINNEEQLYVDTLGINQSFSYSPFEFDGDNLIISATPTSNSLQPPPRPNESNAIWDSYPEYRFNGPNGENPGYSTTDVNYLSGIITSYDSFKMTHGYVEMRAQLPGGPGLWPAFWLLNTHYVENSPEIDVMEFLGQNTDTLYHTYHYFDIQDNWRKISTPSFETIGADWTAGFHKYGMAWSPNAIVWYVDGQETRRITDNDFKISSQAMYLLANLAVGGDWPKSPDETTEFPAEFKIDYIRAYKKSLNEPLDLATDFQLMFNDEFNDTSLDTNKWNTTFLWGPYHTINNEEQYYVDTNGIDSDKNYSPFSFESEGNTNFLRITAADSSASGSDLPPNSLPPPNDSLWIDNPEFQQGPFTEPKEYTSGMITSYDAFKFVNGYAEIRARVPKGDGLWPAFWLLNAYYVGPLPEIDIMEILGEDPSIAYHTYHRSNSVGQQHSDQFTSTKPGTSGGGYSDSFHTFGVHWQPGKITWYVDGDVVDTLAESTLDENDAYQLMYVIANLAVGGNFNTQNLDESAIPAFFDIDYIRVYQENDVAE